MENASKRSEFWKSKKVAVTGGAAMIGSELVRQLVTLNPAELWVVDDLSSGKRENLPKDVELAVCDLREYSNALMWLQGADVVISLAAAHGGRAYVDTHALECYQNFEIDTSVFRAAADAGVEKVVYMSSACAYDVSTQWDVDADVKLSEDLIDYNKPILADGAYGFQKEGSERILQAYGYRGLFKGVAVRGFTVYGRYVSLTHFVGAAIAKTIIKQDPLEIFGDGNQKRNWTYSVDTARGILLAAEKMDRGVVNIGTEEVNTPNSVYKILWEMLDWKPQEIKYRNELIGTANRVADASKAKEILGWEPQYTFEQGLWETVDWFAHSHTVDELRNNFTNKLFER